MYFGVMNALRRCRIACLAVAIVASAVAQSPGRVFSAVLGGAGQDYAGAVTSDAAGNTYVAGLTYSPDFPVTPGAFQTKFGGTSDAFVAKLGPDGKVVWATYLGGTLDDAATGIALDPAGDVVVSGYTRSANFPIANAFQNILNHGFSLTAFDGFIAKLDPTGSKLLYSTFLGSPQDDFLNGMASDHSGNVYVTGTVMSSAGFTGFPSTASGLGIFVSKLDSQGALVYSFFHPYGKAVSIAVDSAGGAYVAGTAYAINPGSATHSFGPAGTQEALVFKLSADGSKILYETTLGGSVTADATAVAVDRRGSVYVAGLTTSVDFPLVKPLQNTLGARPLWASTDGGNTWTPFDDLPFAEAVAMVQDPTAPKTLYVATSDQGMLKSMDGGFTWIHINHGLSDTNLTTVTIDPQHPQTLYTGTNAGNGPIFKTVDGGASWSLITTRDSGGGIAQILVDAQNSNNVYGEWGNNLARKSTDAGATWIDISLTSGNEISYLALDPAVSGNLYAFSPIFFGGIFGPHVDPYIWHSADGGAHWTMIAPPPFPATASGMLIDPSTKPSTVYNGFTSRSPDNGATWMPLGPSPVSTPDTRPIALDATGTFYADVTNVGMFASHDHAQTWTPIGLPTSPLNSNATTTNIIAIVPTTDPATLYTLVRNLRTSAFVAKLRPDGSSIAFSTFLRGRVSFATDQVYIAEPAGITGQNQVGAIALDPAGNVVVAGQTRANDFPTANPTHSANAGLGDAFITSISADGGKIVYSTYFGGSRDDGALAMNIDAQGNVIIAGQTWSSDFPGGVQPPAGQLGDAFVAKIPLPGPPTIDSVRNGASFQPGIESGSWVTITGTNLANTSPGRTWTDSEVINGNLPTSLDGVSVTINGKSAFVYYISPTQINIQAPSDATTGPVDVVVNNNGAISAPAAAQLQTAAPAFFTHLGTTAAIASRLPDYTVVGGPGSSGTAALKPGDTIVLWGTGFGPTDPPVAAGAAVSGAPVAVTTPTVTVGGASANVISAVLTTGTAGLYQITIQLPSNLPAGAQVVQATIGTLTTPAGVTLVIGN
jgi:uncharacterized protein (TIGR03437 family)